MLLSTGAPINIAPRVRTGLRLAVILITLMAWWATYYQARNMGLLMRLGVPMSLGMEGSTDLTSFTVFTLMWAVMMIAMMLPSSYPTLILHRTVYSKRTPQASGGTFLFGVSYFAVWSASGTLFYFAYALMGRWRVHLNGSESVVVRAAGIALVVAGIYQWSRLKSACLNHCQSPLGFVMEHWHDGRSGAVRMGALHGVYCFGCCWGLMVVLFIMGIMHIGWMAAVAIVILVEKLMPGTSWFPRLAGLAMVVIGTLILVSPDFLMRFSSHVILHP